VIAVTIVALLLFWAGATLYAYLADDVSPGPADEVILRMIAQIQAFRVQALACVFGQQQPKGCTLNACLEPQSRVAELRSRERRLK
jgi:hypothetical protein